VCRMTFCRASLLVMPEPCRWKRKQHTGKAKTLVSHQNRTVERPPGYRVQLIQPSTQGWHGGEWGTHGALHGMAIAEVLSSY
jgi:hypothetical protein